MDNGYSIYSLVSILVLLDVALKGALMVSNLRPKASFNPCSLGCCSERWQQNLQQLKEDQVSILVLLDVALKGMNFDGARDFIMKFQSLFSWMLLWKEMEAGTGEQWEVLFQSLFSWMLLWKRRRLKRGERKMECFNPCSLGCCSESLQAARGAVDRHVSILVLLDVALKEVSLTVFQMYYHSSFNPCSLGCCSESSVRTRFVWGRWHVSILVLLDVALKDGQVLRSGISGDWFQSLFSWMLLWKSMGTLHYGHPTKFQSLFSWMLLWKEEMGLEAFQDHPCFNPCSLGCCSESLEILAELTAGPI